jgi:hypothetical protein
VCTGLGGKRSPNRNSKFTHEIGGHKHACGYTRHSQTYKYKHSVHKRQCVDASTDAMSKCDKASQGILQFTHTRTKGLWHPTLARLALAHTKE